MVSLSLMLYGGLVISVLLLFKKMSNVKSPFFKIGYFLYSRTRIGQYYFQRELSKAKQKFEHGHSVTQDTQFDGLKIHPIPMSEDNYAYLVIDQKNDVSILVDPADPEVVQEFIDKEKVTPSAILTTHKHWDHSGGNSEFKRRYRDILIYGGAMDSIPAVTNPVADGDNIEVGSLRFRVKFTPGHTVGHVVYILDGSPFNCPNSLFSGDHLFISGCGRMFEGPPTTMLRSLDSLLELSDCTLVWPGHEYARDNLEFSSHLEPDNEEIKEKLAHVLQLRQSRACTAPSNMGEEKKLNPFLRTSEEKMLQILGFEQKPTVEENFAVRAKALAEIRERKDKFKYKL
ncbi:probable hydrolase PNKD isoform X1 [Lingula anatina]|uniref:Probable hydrolase PNKD isoform X1 n=1 Tax=Lingula anatina TaxID=7574 RepID=A0A1S3INX8_LINAN|nr:probable hydrolase PNKD isoform X2 [Lingula anatina]XP_013399950.1 probable hydrolase PNKD isoform X2 [Lingula anatina]XP_013399951.1 probable hydrolase PNKD isoform X1 [Lingula anatina]|eukprot:XP_013399949.1 probable hydrolase PNKD isoform X2 [Lingula anatina]